MTAAHLLLASSLALAVTTSAPSLASAMTTARSEAAYPGAVGRTDRGAGPAGRSSFRREHRSMFQGSAGGWGFAHGGEARAHRSGWSGGRHFRRFDGFGYPYYGDGYAAAYGPGSSGPDQPYGDGISGGFPPAARPMAPALAPLAYGPGVHDGAYAYGYNGYAQTPPLPVGFTNYEWSTVVNGRGCGC